jgi:hypothetical protein
MSVYRPSASREFYVDRARLILTPCSIQSANEYVARWHRHHQPVRSALFALAALRGSAVDLCGVCIIGRPKARGLQDGRTCEVVRLASDGSANVCSFLYDKARRAAQALGYRRCITYTLATEGGASLRALGLAEPQPVKGKSWDTPARRRTDKHPTTDKLRWDLLECVS